MHKRLLLLVTLLGLLTLACSLVSAPSPTPTPAASVTKQVAIAPKVTPTSLSPTIVPPATVQVATDGSGDYRTLPEAVEAVAPGSTIRLTAGSHQLPHWPLEIDKPLTLIGEGRDLTEIVGGPVSATVIVSGTDFMARDLAFRYVSAEEGDAVLVRGGRATFENCRFTGAVIAEDGDVHAGLRVQQGAQVTVEGCEAVDNAGAGIRVEEGSDAIIKTCTCSDNGKMGISLRDATADVRDNVCERNGYSGIAASGATHATVENNLVSENIETGIVFFDESDGMVRGNTATKNGYHGITAHDTSAPTVEANVCAENEEAGIRIVDLSTALVHGNECYGNGLSGIIVVDAAMPTVEDNSFHDNGESGVAFFDAAGGTVRGNQVISNTRHGIDLYGSSAPKVVGNTVEDNVEAGIRISDQAQPVVRNNVCRHNGLSGLIVREEASPTLLDNRLEANQSHGMIFFQESGGVAKGNTVTGNEKSGISVNDRAAPTLRANEMTDNGEAGIAFFDQAGGVARDNTITNNKWGIYVEEGANPTLGENTVHDNVTDIDDRRGPGPHPTPTAKAAITGTVLFEEDFSSPDTAWLLEDSDDGRAWFEDGKLYVRNRTDAPGDTVALLKEAFDDVIIEVQSRHEDGSLDDWHEIACRLQSDGDHYRVGYSADGYVEALGVLDGEAIPFLEPVTSTVVKQGTGVTNAMRLACVGNEMTFWLNDQLIANFTDDQLAQGYIALRVSALGGEYTEVTFDDLVVRQPQ